jgi:hypothetical protein
MNTPDIAGLCKRLDILHEWQSSPRDRETITLSKTTLERQDAENKRLRKALEKVAAYYGPGHRITEIARAALTGEDTATLSLSGKTQTRGDACTS